MARDREALTKGDLTNCSEHSPADREFLRPVPTQAFKECTNKCHWKERIVGSFLFVFQQCISQSNWQLQMNTLLGYMCCNIINWLLSWPGSSCDSLQLSRTQCFFQKKLFGLLAANKDLAYRSLTSECKGQISKRMVNSKKWCKDCPSPKLYYPKLLAHCSSALLTSVSNSMCLL